MAEVQYPFYKKPKGSEAAVIWYQSGLYDLEPLPAIESALWAWVEDNKVIQRCEESKENVRIRWNSPAGIGYHWTWTSFVKWMLCSCGDPVAPSKPIHPVQPIQPSMQIIEDPTHENVFIVNLD
jgi:hypothetical protein